MKKIICILILLLPNLVEAKCTSDIQYATYPNIYSNRMEGDYTFSEPLSIVSIENRIAYSLTPYVYIDQKVPLCEVDSYELEMIDYYRYIFNFGYQYPGNEVIEYYMAGQELIWTEISKSKIFWSQTPLAKKDLIDIENYKYNILNSCGALYNKVPKMDGKYYKEKVGSVLKIEDQDDLLQFYQVKQAGNNNVWIEDNTLYVEVLSDQEERIILIPKEEVGQDKLYMNPSTKEQYIVFGITNLGEVSFVVEGEAPPQYHLDIQFRNTFGSDIPYQFSFSIYDVDNQQYIVQNGTEIFSTDENGYFISDFRLPYGNYQIIPTHVPMEYYSDVTLFCVKNTNTLNYVVSLEEQMGKIRIYAHKEVMSYQDDTFVSKDIIEENKEFQIYAKQDILDSTGRILYPEGQFIESVKTDNTGYVYSNLLPIGTYNVMGSDTQAVSFSYEENPNHNNEQFIEEYQKIPISTFEIESYIYNNGNKFENNSILYKLVILADENLGLTENKFLYNFPLTLNGKTKGQFYLPNGNYQIYEVNDLEEKLIQQFIIDEKHHSFQFHFEKEQLQPEIEYEDDIVLDVMPNTSFQGANLFLFFLLIGFCIYEKINC